MNSDQNELFLTRIDAGGIRSASPANHRAILSQVRKEHTKIQEVVDAFRSKVDRMVDKQRQEYVSAYEHHIQDVQKELHQLREKANQIANDRTKNERTEKLKADLNRYKNEALQLETDSDELRVEMARLVKQVYSVEKYRDWMLKKLRQTKKQYNALVREKSKLADDQFSVSNASSYTLELANPAHAKNLTATEQRFNRAMHEQATVRRQPLQPKARPARINPPSHVSPTMALESMKRRKSYQGDALNQNALAELLTARARSEELMEFIRDCQGSLHRRPFSKVEKRGLDAVMEAVRERLHHNEDGELALMGSEEETLSLACELAAMPQIYDSLLMLITGHHFHVQRRNSPKNKNNYNTLGTTFAEDDDEFFNHHSPSEHIMESRFADEDTFRGGKKIGMTLDNLDAFLPKF